MIWELGGAVLEAMNPKKSFSVSGIGFFDFYFRFLSWIGIISKGSSGRSLFRVRIRRIVDI